MTAEPTPVFAGRRIGVGLLLLLVAVVMFALAAFGAHPGLPLDRFAFLAAAAGWLGLLLLVIGV